MKSFLRIEKPCEESLENMHTVSGGKFCDLCSKKVIDFSDSDIFEISKILEDHKGKEVCGIFFKDQLHDPLPQKEIINASADPKTLSFSKVVAGLALTASIINSYPAQTKNIIKKETVNDPGSKKQNNKPEIKTNNGNFIISGRIISDNKRQPLAATVNFITALKVYSTKTDKDGYYSLEVPKEIIKYESLLEFSPHQYMYDRKLVVYTIENLRKKQLIKLDYNSMDKMLGEVSYGPPGASENSYVLVDGRKADYRLFNKSYGLYSRQYNVYYIPQEFVKFFTTKETIKDIFLVFIKPK